MTTTCQGSCNRVPHGSDPDPSGVLAMTPDAGYIKFVPGAVSLSKALAQSNGDAWWHRETKNMPRNLSWMDKWNILPNCNQRIIPASHLCCCVLYCTHVAYGPLFSHMVLARMLQRTRSWGFVDMVCIKSPRAYDQRPGTEAWKVCVPIHGKLFISTSCNMAGRVFGWLEYFLGPGICFKKWSMGSISSCTWTWFCADMLARTTAA